MNPAEPIKSKIFLAISVTKNLDHYRLEDAAEELKRVEELADARKELEKVKGENPVSQKMFRAI